MSKVYGGNFGGLLTLKTTDGLWADGSDVVETTRRQPLGPSVWAMSGRQAMLWASHDRCNGNSGMAKPLKSGMYAPKFYISFLGVVPVPRARWCLLRKQMASLQPCQRRL